MPNNPQLKSSRSGLRKSRADKGMWWEIRCLWDSSNPENSEFKMSMKIEKKSDQYTIYLTRGRDFFTWKILQN